MAGTLKVNDEYRSKGAINFAPGVNIILQFLLILHQIVEFQQKDLFDVNTTNYKLEFYTPQLDGSRLHELSSQL